MYTWAEQQQADVNAEATLVHATRDAKCATLLPAVMHGHKIHICTHTHVYAYAYAHMRIHVYVYATYMCMHIRVFVLRICIPVPAVGHLMGPTGSSKVGTTCLCEMPNNSRRRHDK